MRPARRSVFVRIAECLHSRFVELEGIFAFRPRPRPRFGQANFEDEDENEDEFRSALVSQPKPFRAFYARNQNERSA
jgi:hypothetical protein